ncbi:MAG: flavin reductase family protein [Halobacteriovoraceae bacterium]|nr:flavin reductase family protein [Halobacteriovoraceae bacterium]
MKKLTLEDIEAWKDDRKRARFINCLSGVKTGVLIGTADEERKSNLAIFSSLFHLGANPALMGFVVRPDVSPRHTLENIKNIGYYTINILPFDEHLKGHHTSARFPEETSEFSAVGLSEEYFSNQLVPFVKESKVKWLMELVRIIDIEENNTHIIIGKVLEVLLPEEILDTDGTLDIAATNPSLVTGLDSYHQVKKGQRYTYAKPDREPKKL